jgi:hypothetical protein
MAVVVGKAESQRRGEYREVLVLANASSSDTRSSFGTSFVCMVIICTSVAVLVAVTAR